MKRFKLFGIILLFLLVILISFADIIPKKVQFSENMVMIGKEEYNISRGRNLTIGNETQIVFRLKKKPFEKSKNFIILPENTNIKTASELLDDIPGCDSINYWNESEQKWYGWISLRGGRGKNFEIIPNTIYEISVKDTTDWIVSNK